MKPILEVNNLTKHYIFREGIKPWKKKILRAVNGISFHVEYGETMGLVGESGCGKTTTARLVLRLIEATAGEVIFEGKNIFALNKEQLNRIKREMQIIFQDPLSSLNPRMSVSKIVEEPLVVHGIGKVERKKRVNEVLESVGLSPKHQGDKIPQQLSGGQRQRVSIARALILNPKIIVCDEPVSALDVSIQSQILNLLRNLQRKYSLTYLFISHDLSVVKHIADNVAVMYAGRIIEQAPKEIIFKEPLHPYTKGLLSSVPVPDPRAARKRSSVQYVKGEVPDLFKLPRGCRFYPRCYRREDRCLEEDPPLVNISQEHKTACLML